MKKLILLALLWTSSALSGMTFNTISGGLLANDDNEVRFQSGAISVPLINGDWFRMQGFGDRVEFQSVSRKDWYFDNKVIYPNELDLSNIANVKESDVLTITATAHHDNSTQYYIDTIKYRSAAHNNALMYRIVSVRPILPEPSSYALLAGLLAFCCIALRRRGMSA